MIPINLFSIILITGFVHGIVLFVAISRIKKKNQNANKFLLTLIGLISIALIGRLAYLPEIYEINLKLAMLPDFILFLFGPIWLMYFRTLLTKQLHSFKKNWRHFIPAGLHMLYIMILLGFDNDEYVRLALAGKFYLPIHILLTLSLMHNIVYWVWSLKLVLRYRRDANQSISYDQNVKYLLTLLGFSGACLSVWFVSELIALVPFGRPDFITYGNVWIALTVLVYVMAFFAISQPELFRINIEPEKYQSSRLKGEDITKLARELDEIMKKETLYKNPKLTRQVLEDRTSWNAADLSRVINEGFEKNFFDFVNHYRIEAFKKLVASEKYNHLTLLAIAKEAGFNSKTTFNTAFKKQTGYTPKAYLASQDVNLDIASS